ncbi:MAG: hypothetical protein MUF21_09645, partial [Gemmatimonadaceae bacterium]|nr:hypothetical protein [Gemmatimonadaceae bacterium]
MERLTMRHLLVVTAAALSIPPALPAQDAAARRIVVAATTDVHGRLRAWDYYDGRPDSARSLAAAATIVDSVRA